jgi:hypothetical protein
METWVLVGVMGGGDSQASAHPHALNYRKRKIEVETKKEIWYI